MDDLDVLFGRLRVRPHAWKLLGRLTNDGAGWFLRDPVFRDHNLEVPQAWPGSWVLHARLRNSGAVEEVQFLCLWEELSALPTWVAQEPLPLETGCLVLCGAARFRTDAIGPGPYRYRGFYAEHPGDPWMLAGFQGLDHAVPDRDVPVPHVLTTDEAWFQTEPILVPWDLAVLEGRACGMRWTLPLEGAATWDP